jgi:hypothetical protein
MFDLWYDLPPILRAGLGILLMAISVVIYFMTESVHIVTIGLAATGLVFLLFCTAGKDKGGYNF